MYKYEIRLLDVAGRTVGMFEFYSRNDERARSGIFAIGDVAYDRYEIWRGMEKIDFGARFVLPNSPSAPFADTMQGKAN